MFIAITNTGFQIRFLVGDISEYDITYLFGKQTCAVALGCTAL